MVHTSEVAVGVVVAGAATVVVVGTGQGVVGRATEPTSASMLPDGTQVLVTERAAVAAVYPVPVPVADCPGERAPPGLSAIELDSVAVDPMAHASLGTATVQVTEYVPLAARHEATPVISVWNAAAVPGITATTVAAARNGRASLRRERLFITTRP